MGNSKTWGPPFETAGRGGYPALIGPPQGEVFGLPTPLAQAMKILYIKGLYGFSLVISELPMAVSSGLSISSPSYGSRSAWTLSWPLAFGLVMFACLMNA